MLNLPSTPEGKARKALPAAPDRPLPAFQALAQQVALTLAENGVNAVLIGKGPMLRVSLRRGAAVYDARHEAWQYRGKHYNGSTLLFARWVKEQP